MSKMNDIRDSVAWAAVALASVGFGAGCSNEKQQHEQGQQVSPLVEANGLPLISQEEWENSGHKIREAASHLKFADIVGIHSTDELFELANAKLRVEERKAIVDAASYLTMDQLRASGTSPKLFEAARENGWTGEVPPSLKSGRLIDGK